MTILDRIITYENHLRELTQKLTNYLPVLLQVQKEKKERKKKIKNIKNKK